MFIYKSFTYPFNTLHAPSTLTEEKAGLLDTPTPILNFECTSAIYYDQK